MKYLSLSIPGYGKIDSDLPVPTGGLFTTGMDLIQVLVVLVMTLAILVSLWFMIKGGIDMIQSQGKKEKLNSGRERVVYATFGLIILFLTITVVSIISAAFDFDLLPFLKFR